MELLTNLNANKNELQNAVGHKLATAPASPVQGQVYFNTTDDVFYFYDGTKWVEFGGDIELPEPSDAAPLVAGTANPGTSKTYSRADHVHPAQTSITGNAATATKLKTAANIGITGAVTGTAASFDGSKAVNITATSVDATKLTGVVPESSLPSYVDDVIDAYVVGSTPYAAGWLSLKAGGGALTPENGKIYVVVSAGDYVNKTYRWSGTIYVEISSAPAIATTEQAKAGTDDTTIMTPLKVHEVIANMPTTALMMQTGTLTQGATSVQITATGVIASVSCRNSTTFEEVLCDLTYTSDMKKVTVSIAKAAAADIDIYVVYQG